MKNTWVIWLLIVVLVVGVLVIFNYQGSKDAVPLSEIFPDEEVIPMEIEYIIEDEQPPQKIAKQEIKQVKQIIPSIKKGLKEDVKTEFEEQVKSKVKAQEDIQGSVYTIQVASFKEKQKAQSFLDQLIKQDFPAYITTKNLADKGTWHRVYIGEFSRKQQAEAMLTAVRQKFSSSFIILHKK